MDGYASLETCTNQLIRNQKRPVLLAKSAYISFYENVSTEPGGHTRCHEHNRRILISDLSASIKMGQI